LAEWTLLLTTIFALYLLLQVSYICVSILLKKNPNVSAVEQKITVLIPSFNEELVLLQCLEGWNRVRYTHKEAIFINDGSTDQTMELLHDLLELAEFKQQLNTVHHKNSIKIFESKKFPEIYVVDQLNGGKSDALNTGISLATGDIVITLDADSILESDSLSKINQAFADPLVVAAGGMVHVGQLINRRGSTVYGQNMLIRYQLSGYLSSFYVRKATQSKLNVLGVVSGAFGAFRRDVLVKIGGYKQTLGEDMEITFRLQKYIKERKLGEKLIFVPEAVCYTEVPETFKALLHQRIRWQKGFLDCINLYKKDFFMRLSKRFSIFLLFESLMLGTLGTLALIVLPVTLLLGNVSNFTFLLIATAWSSEFILRLIAVQRAGHFGYVFSLKCWFKIVIFTIWESFTFRLLDTFFFLYGTILYVVGSRSNWNKLQRSGSVIYTELQPLEKIPV